MKRSTIIRMPRGEIISPLLSVRAGNPRVIIETFEHGQVSRSVTRHLPTAGRAIVEYERIVDALLLVGEFLED